MLLVHPVTEIVKFLPALVLLLVASTATDRDPIYQLAIILVPIVIGLVRWFTTRYRVTKDRIELRRGLLSRSVMSTPLDRVRTVDLTAKPVHRLLGLSTVRIGTGTGTGKDDGFDLDALRSSQARELRARLLHSIAGPAPVGTDPDEPVATDGADRAVPDERVVARFEPGWLRYAAFTSAGPLLVAAAIGVGSQLLGGLGVYDDLDPVAVERRLVGLGLLLVPLVLVVLLVAGAVFSVLGYLLANGNFALSHTARDGTWHLRRGLLTVRETSVDADRLRGVRIGEPLGLRVVGGGSLDAIVTGLDPGQQGSETLLPPAPRAVVDQTAGELLGARGPVTAPLTDHGPRARARRYVRALVPTLVLGLSLAVVVWLLDLPRLLLAVPVVLPLLGLGLARDRSRGLGHALADGFLVARSGSLTRHREILAADAIIGWTVTATWFQRRAGLVNLTATTAGGKQRVIVVDVPRGEAERLANAAIPGLVSQFSGPAA